MTAACARPFVARDGTLVFQEKGAHGAAIVTANGLEYHDVRDVPDRVVVRDPYEPWRAPVGFIIPKSGRFTKTSQAAVVGTTGLAIALRPSDTRVPAWGGEMLVRVDVIAPAAEGTARYGEDLGIVIDARGDRARALFEAALARLGGRDRVVVVDSAEGKVVVPTMPAANRSLVMAAIETRLAAAERAPRQWQRQRDRTRAVKSAALALTRATLRRVMVVTDDAPAASEDAKRALAGDDLVPLAVVSTSDADALSAVQQFVPEAGAPAFGNVVLAFDATPAPAHVIEASGGDARWRAEGGELSLGLVRSGDERAEVVRVNVPAWTAGENFSLHVTARFDDFSREAGSRRSMTADLPCVYDDDIERIAESRHGDVIAYASALATLARLDAAFLGGERARAADLLPVARMHAQSLSLLARDMHDPAAAETGWMLEALLGAISGG